MQLKNKKLKKHHLLIKWINNILKTMTIKCLKSARTFFYKYTFGVKGFNFKDAQFLTILMFSFKPLVIEL